MAEYIFHPAHTDARFPFYLSCMPTPTRPQTCSPCGSIKSTFIIIPADALLKRYIVLIFVCV